MHELAALQQAVAGALTANNISELGIGKALRLSCAESLAIYRNSMQSALLTVLIDNYPVCQKIVGEDFFRAMSLLYLRETVSVSANINDYGESFADFVAAFPHAQSLPYLADVLRLEWCLQRVAVGQDYQDLALDALMQVAQEDYPGLQFALPVNSYLLASDYPIEEIWRFNQTVGDEVLELDGLASAKLLIWRPEWTPVVTVLNNAEWELLQALKHGATVAELCDRFAAYNIPELLGELVAKGWLNQFFGV